MEANHKLWEKDIELFEKMKGNYVSDNEANFFKTVKAAFSQRRKTAENSLSSGTGIKKDVIAQALAEAGLEKTVRAEKMTMEDFAKLSDILFD